MYIFFQFEADKLQQSKYDCINYELKMKLIGQC